MTALFTTIVTQPLYNLLVGIYDILPWTDLGVAIIITTLVIKFAMVGLSRKQIASQKKMQELQPEMKEIQEKYKDDKETQTREIFAMYKKHKTTPFSGCLPIIVQIITFMGLYYILYKMTGDSVPVRSELLYSFVPNPGTISPTFFGMNIGNPSPILALLAAATQYWQMKIMLDHKDEMDSLNKDGSKKDLSKAVTKDPTKPDMQEFAHKMGKQMLYIGPALTLFIGLTFPGGLALYWFISTGFTAIQQQFIMRGDKREAAEAIATKEATSAQKPKSKKKGKKNKNNKN